MAALMTRADALSQVYREEWQRMVGIVARALPRGEAEDVVAQAFADVWAIGPPSDVEALRRYVWKAVWNGCADTHRRGRHVREVELDLRTQTVGVREFGAADARLDVQRGWASLTDKQQRVIWLHYVNRLPFPEIGRRVGLNENGAKSLALRGRRAMYRQLTGKAR